MQEHDAASVDFSIAESAQEREVCLVYVAVGGVSWRTILVPRVWRCVADLCACGLPSPSPSLKPVQAQTLAHALTCAHTRSHKHSLTHSLTHHRIARAWSGLRWTMRWCWTWPPWLAGSLCCCQGRWTTRTHHVHRTWCRSRLGTSDARVCGTEPRLGSSQPWRCSCGMATWAVLLHGLWGMAHWLLGSPWFE